MNKDEYKAAMKALESFKNALDSIPDETMQQYRERIDFRLEQGLYPAKILTPDGGVFRIEQAHAWGKSITPQQNVDLDIEQVPKHLRDSGLGECELVIESDGGIELLRGPLKDDGNRQDGLGWISTAIVKQEREQ